MKRTCDKCKSYKEKQEFNCEFYKICIPDINMANNCTSFTSKSPRKRCKKCKYLEYRGVIKKKSSQYAYVCVKRNKPISYTALVNCNKFEKLNE